jgi:hypothetical protein
MICLRKLINNFSLAFVLAFLPGCFLVPFIDSFHKIGVTESDRQSLLGKSVKGFGDARYWGSYDVAVTFVDPDFLPNLQEFLKQTSDTNEKVVDSKITSVQYESNSWRAKVSVLVRAYRVPYYIVRDRHEEQNWKFDISRGQWRLTDASLAMQ